MHECSKAVMRRVYDGAFVGRYFAGDSIDIGGAPDPLSLYVELFPLLKTVRVWDLEDGDAQFMASVADDSYATVHSSHCLEHLHDPLEALQNWLRICKPGGYVVVTIPDEDLYEQGVFPSTMNRDHKWTFTLSKERSWSDRSINVLDLLSKVGPRCSVERVVRLDQSYRFDLPRYDQTRTPVGESAIEIVLRKRTDEEVAAGGRLPGDRQPDPAIRRHLNQYKDDHDVLKAHNRTSPPFRNEAEIS